MKTYQVYVNHGSAKWSIQASGFTVTEAGFIVFWREGEKYATLNPSGYRFVVELEPAET